MNKKVKPVQHHKPISKIAVYAILFLIIITFIGAPIITFRAQNSIDSLSFGSYYGKKIVYNTDNYFGRSVQGNITQFQEQFKNQGSLIILLLNMHGKVHLIKL